MPTLFELQDSNKLEQSCEQVAHLFHEANNSSVDTDAWNPNNIHSTQELVDRVKKWVALPFDCTLLLWALEGEYIPKECFISWDALLPNDSVDNAQAQIFSQMSQALSDTTNEMFEAWRLVHTDPKLAAESQDLLDGLPPKNI